MAEHEFNTTAQATGVQITPLLRAKELTHDSQVWTAPDLQATMVKESRQVFERALANVRKEVAAALVVLRDAELSKAREQGLSEGKALGYEQGYAQGYAEASAVAQAEVASQQAAFAETQAHWLSEVQQKTEALLQGITQSLSGVEDLLLQDMIWLSAQMAQRLVADALQLQPERVQQLVSQVVQQLPHVIYPLHIELHPEDVPRIDPVLLAREGRVELHANTELQQGECVVRSGHSELSRQWQEQTQRLIDRCVREFLEQWQPQTPVELANDDATTAS